MSMERELTDEIKTRNIISPDPRKNLYDEDMHRRGRMLPLKRVISRNHFNKFEDFIADVCDDTYSNIVEHGLDKRKHPE